MIHILLLTLLFFANSVGAANSDFYATSNEPHTVQLYTHGPSALKAYVAMIESAKTSVDLESFVFEPDRAGLLIVQALREKAKQHIPVRVMIDAYKKSFSQEELDDLLSLGIQVRFYNPKLLYVVHLLPIDHRKFLIIDGKKVFFGGRNLSEENFGIDAKKRRLDYSIEMEGSIVADILKSYNAYWNSSIVRSVESSGHPQFVMTAEALQLKASLEQMPMQIAGEFRPTELEFVSDEPTDQKRLFSDFLAKKLSAVQRNVVIETPSFAIGSKLNSVLGNLLKQNKMVSLLTVGKIDHSATLSYSVLSLGFETTEKGLKQEGGAVFFKQETVSSEALPLLDPKTEDVPWGSHCKATIFDGKDVLLGSFNYDVLSEEHNSEAGVFFLNAPEIVAALHKIESSRSYVRQ